MRFRQLEYFCRVFELNSFHKAAESLYVSQPSISEAIRQLEEEIGLPLVDRSNKTIGFTLEGKLLYQRSAEILDRISETILEIRAMQDSRTKPVRVVVPPIIGNFIFLKIFMAFHEKHSGIVLNMEEQGSISAVPMIRNDEADFGFLIYDEYIELETEPILNTEIVFCTSRNSHLAASRSLKLVDVRNEPLIMLNDGSYHNRVVKEQFSKIACIPNTALYTSQISTIKSFITHEIGSAFLIRELVAGESGILGIPMNPAWNVQIGLVWKKGKKLTANAEQFLDFVRNSMKFPG